MPRLANMLRLNKVDGQPKNIQGFSQKKSGASVFRDSSKVSSKDDSRPAIEPIQSCDTWTLSESSLSPASDDGRALLMSHDVFELSEQNRSKSTQGTLPVEQLTFTPEQVRDNELNHMRAVIALQEEIHELRHTNETMVSEHEIEMKKKEKDNSDLRIAINDKDQELVTLRAQLENSKKELETASVKLLRTQHELFDMRSRFASAFPWRKMFS